MKTSGLGRRHLPVDPGVRHVAAHDGESRIGLFLGDDRVGELGGVAVAHLHAGKLGPCPLEDLRGVGGRDRSLVVAAHHVGEPRPVAPALRRREAAPVHPAVARRKAQQHARAVRPLPPAQHGKRVEKRHLLAAGVDAHVEELHAGVGKHRRQSPRLVGHVGLLDVSREVEAVAPRGSRAEGEHPHQLLEVGRLGLDGERIGVPYQPALADGLFKPPPTAGRRPLQHHVDRPCGNRPAGAEVGGLVPVRLEQSEGPVQVGRAVLPHQFRNGGGVAHVKVAFRRDNHLFEVRPVLIRRERRMRRKHRRSTDRRNQKFAFHPSFPFFT